MFPKAPKLQASQATLARQDTIDEDGEMDTSPPNRENRIALPDGIGSGTPQLSSIMIKERNLALERERQIEMASSRATTSDTYDTGLREQPPTLAQRDLIATVLDLKVDVRLELQRMQQRIGRIEDILSELVRRLQQDSSGQTTPADENVCVCGALIGESNVAFTGRRSDILTTITTTTTTTTGTPPPNASIVTADTVINIPTSNVVTTAGMLAAASTSSGIITAMATTTTTILTTPLQIVTTSFSGNGLGPLLLRKRRSKGRKAPAPPRQLLPSVITTISTATSSSSAPVHSPEEQSRLLEEESPITTTAIVTTASPSGSGAASISMAASSSVSSSGVAGGRSKREFL